MERDMKTINRRQKSRFPIVRELRYKLLDEDTVAEMGIGNTIDISSAGISFRTNNHRVKVGCFIELSISWPVLLADTCPMRLVVYGRVLRSSQSETACSVDKYEFRTQSRQVPWVRPENPDSLFQRWVEGFRKEAMKTRMYNASA